MNWNDYANSGIRLKYPANWYVKDEGLSVKEMIVMISEESLESACDDESSDLIRNINLAVEVIDLDREDFVKIKNKPLEILKKYVSDKLEVLEANIEDFNLLERENSISSGYLSAKVMYTGKFMSHSLKWIQFFFVVDSDIISILTATALESKFTKDFMEIVKNMVDSIELVA